MPLVNLAVGIRQYAVGQCRVDADHQVRVGCVDFVEEEYPAALEDFNETCRLVLPAAVFLRKNPAHQVGLGYALA
jgi:hypothetical protein